VTKIKNVKNVFYIYEKTIDKLRLLMC